MLYDKCTCTYAEFHKAAHLTISFLYLLSVYTLVGCDYIRRHTYEKTAENRSLFLMLKNKGDDQH